MVIVLLIACFIFYSSAKAKNWPPKCDKNGNPPKGSDKCSPPKGKVLLINGVIILVLILLIWFSWSMRNNKYWQGLKDWEQRLDF